jgi:predicted anti-sigma-YlaC factor YlaD
MNRHLGEQEITTAVAGLELEAAAAEHLGSCVSCRQLVLAMREAIEGRKRDLEAESPDWERQREEILRRLPSASARRRSRKRVSTRLLLATAAILVAAIGLKALWTPEPPPDPASGVELPVEQILAEVDAVLADESIPGLELVDPDIDEEIFENGAS